MKCDHGETIYILQHIHNKLYARSYFSVWLCSFRFSFLVTSAWTGKLVAFQLRSF